MALNIYCQNPHSEGAKALSEALGVKRIKHGPDSKYRGRPEKTVINWGSSQPLPEEVSRSSIINSPRCVALATNKLTFFQTCQAANAGPRIPEWTTNRDVVRQWLQNGSKAVARTVLNGHSGAGIVILEGAAIDIPNAPLYTKYVPKKEEWRIHILRVGNELSIIDQQRKIRDPNNPGIPNWNVRSHDNGFIFAREVDPPSPDVLVQALLALDATGLDFGAVDVLWNQQQGAAFVLEINTAPGLTGQTVVNYAEAFRRRFGG